MAGRLDEAAFQATADDAVRLAVAAQLRAGVDLLTDGEQRRDSYASFVASRLDNCQLTPLTDLLPLVDDREEFERELRALDVPAGDVPYLFGTLEARHGAGGIDALDRSCSDAFAQAWVAFARHGDPGPLPNPGLSA